MQLTIREVARLLSVPERAVYRWLDDGEIPACRVEEEVRFNRAELLEWATLRKLPLSEDVLKDPADGGSLGAALEAGGVHHGLGAREPAAILRAMVEALDGPSPEERQVLLDMLLARGGDALTPVGDGVAIPHVRHPAVLSVPRASASLHFLETAVDLQAPDGRPVEALFFLVSPTPRAHLRILSRLAAALRDGGFRAVLARKGTREEILREVRRIEG